MAEKKLKTMAEHYAERREAYQRQADAMLPHANGIECPACEVAELWDSSPAYTLTSNPPQKNVHCPACGYRGYRLA